MPVEVILMSNVEGLGAEGDVVRVAEGHARNFLLPRKLAAPVTAATRRKLERRRLEREEGAKRSMASARALADTLEKTSCTIAVKTGPEGKLFGSVSTLDVSAALKAQGIEVGKHQVMLAEPLRELGVFKVPIKVHSQLEATLKVWIVEE